jgi:hypothetical protein
MTRRLRLAADDGYTMAAVMLVMLVTSIMGGAAFAAVGGDIPFTRASQDRKQAYAAAEAGIEYYLYQLTRDNDYWKTCDTAPGPAGQPNPVNQPNPGVARKWRSVAGTTDARFSIELLPANGEPLCELSTAAQPTRADDTMIDKDSGTFRIRSTGESRGVRRSIVTTFRRNSFLDFIYFTDYEALDPLTLTSASDQATARAQCVRYREQRNLNAWCSQAPHNMNITFPNWDRINGPLHTNDDSLLTCGSPVFGRPGRQDAIEVVGATPPIWRSGCAGTPTIEGVVRQPWAHLDVPPSNERLKEAALPGYLFHGQTVITLKDTVMDVTTRSPTNANTIITYTNLALPPNGVVFVEKVGTCSIESPVRMRYNSSGPSNTGAGCAVLTLKGTYAKSMTLGSRDDILVNGDIREKTGSDSVLGLIAQRFVRVNHGVTDPCGSNIVAQTLTNLTIEAAILALNDSFIVDNWQCGAALQKLTIKGAIAQRFRGPVGTFSGSTLASGYEKNYNYDDRLRYRSPPYFVEPVKASWKIIRNNEQVRAAE